MMMDDQKWLQVEMYNGYDDGGMGGNVGIFVAVVRWGRGSYLGFWSCGRWTLVNGPS